VSAVSETIYDAVAYPSHPFRQTHPQRLSVAAALMGASYAPMERARVLEIGCGEGGNIIPLALSHPEATIVGFDLAATAVEAGRRIVDQLGLRNIRLEARDILDAGRELGEFDYIIAHGVYSWVPEPVREGLLRTVSECLAPNGLAFVSFNAFPGCHLRMLMRGMMLHHLKAVEGFEARIAKAQEFLRFIVETTLEKDQTSVAIKAQAESMLSRDPRVLFHDELGEIFQPFWMYEFRANADRHGLKHLADADALYWRETLYPTERGEAVARLIGEEPQEKGQYLDFINLRFFRPAILTRAEAAVLAAPDPRRVRGLWARQRALPLDPDPDLESAEPVRFSLEDNVRLSLDHPLIKQAMFRIGQAYPQAIPVAELPDHPDVDKGLLQLFTIGHLDLTTGPGVLTATPGERPVASPLARLQATGGVPVTSQLHKHVRLEDATSRHFVTRLDGTRTRAELAAEMSTPEQPVTTDDIDIQLSKLAELALLIG
jgi:SAM-dependent methyltransferase